VETTTLKNKEWVTRIAFLRKSLEESVTQSDLAVELGVSESTIQNWESGKKKIGAIQFARLSILCRILGCELEELIDPVPDDEPMDYFEESDRPVWKCKISELRKKNRITQKILARKIGITNVTLNSWENQDSSAEFIARTIKLCRILKCSVHELIEEKISSEE
jgi:transcriptional regulator with XRE-family HTH domain